MHDRPKVAQCKTIIKLVGLVVPGSAADVLWVSHVVEHAPDRFHECRIDLRTEDVGKGRVCLAILACITDECPPVYAAKAFFQIVGKHRSERILHSENEGIDRGKLLDLARVNPVDHQPLFVYGDVLKGLDLHPFADRVAQKSRIKGSHVHLEVVDLLRSRNEGQIFAQ